MAQEPLTGQLVNIVTDKCGCKATEFGTELSCAKLQSHWGIKGLRGQVIIEYLHYCPFCGNPYRGVRPETALRRTDAVAHALGVFAILSNSRYGFAAKIADEAIKAIHEIVIGKQDNLTSRNELISSLVAANKEVETLRSRIDQLEGKLLASSKKRYN